MGDNNKMYLAKCLDPLNKKLIGINKFLIFDLKEMLDGDFATWSV